MKITNVSKTCRVAITKPSGVEHFTGFVVAETNSHVCVTSEGNRVGEWFPLDSKFTSVKTYGHQHS